MKSTKSWCFFPQAGDRLMVQPKNEHRLVTLTINSLGATGDEMIPLDATWRRALEGHGKYRTQAVPEKVPLFEFLERAQVSRTLAVSCSESAGPCMSESWRV